VERDGLKMLRIAPTAITTRLKTSSAAISRAIAATKPMIASTIDLIISPTGAASGPPRYSILDNTASAPSKHDRRKAGRGEWKSRRYGVETPAAFAAMLPWFAARFKRLRY
jgi:hypothetical protein